jgi:hypothetical protein
MANEFYTPQAVANLGIALISDDMVLANTVNRDYEADFGGGRGHTVNVRIPAALTARTRSLSESEAITVDDISEDYTTVNLSTHA